MTWCPIWMQSGCPTSLSPEPGGHDGQAVMNDEASREKLPSMRGACGRPFFMPERAGSDAMALYQNTKNGQIVEFVGHHDVNYAMVKNSGGQIAYVPLADLVAYEPGKGRTGEIPVPQSAETKEDPDVVPAAVIPADTRVNLNTASAEEIAKRIKGVGFSTAKKIVELRLSLSGEKFVNLEQVRRVGRVDWDEVIAADLVYVA